MNAMTSILSPLERKEISKPVQRPKSSDLNQPYQQTRADVLEKKYLKRPEYKPFVFTPVKKEDKTIYEKFFDYYTYAHPMFKKTNPYRIEFDKEIEDAIENTKVDAKTFTLQVYNIYLAKQRRRDEDVHPTRQTNTPQESKNN